MVRYSRFDYTSTLYELSQRPGEWALIDRVTDMPNGTAARNSTAGLIAAFGKRGAKVMTRWIEDISTLLVYGSLPVGVELESARGLRVIEWGDPPPRAKPPAVSSKWLGAVEAQLRAHPGAWAEVMSSDGAGGRTPSMNHYRSLINARPGLEAKTRSLRSEARIVLYARAIP